MQTAFIFVSIPSDRELRTDLTGKRLLLQGFGHDITRIQEQYKQVEALAESVWQIPLHNGLLPLSQFLLSIEKAALKYRVLLVEGELNWLE